MNWARREFTHFFIHRTLASESHPSHLAICAWRMTHLAINAQAASEKFASLDRHEVGWLAGDDVMELADWMAHQLRPSERITTQIRLHEALPYIT